MPERKASTYAQAGVDIAAAGRTVALMKEAVKATYTPAVLSETGAFGGLFAVEAFRHLAEPVLVATTDGVGTKTALAAQAGIYESIGIDIVNHCINDLLVQGAHPLFFLDYIASSKLEPHNIAAIVTAMAGACKLAGCALLGGETAEMPGIYHDGHFDVAGTLVGVLDKSALLPRPGIRPGDVLLGLASSGPHTNGYSLIRKVFAETSLDTVFPEIGLPLSDVLLAPHRSYLPLLGEIVTGPQSPIKALVHITGGGFYDNIPRVLSADMGAQIDTSAWPTPPLFSLIQQRGAVPTAEMYHVFNMGIGMVVIVAAEHAAALQTALGEKTWVIGEVMDAKGIVLDG